MSNQSCHPTLTCRVKLDSWLSHPSQLCLMVVIWAAFFSSSGFCRLCNCPVRVLPRFLSSHWFGVRVIPSDRWGRFYFIIILLFFLTLCGVRSDHLTLNNTLNQLNHWPSCKLVPTINDGLIERSPPYWLCSTLPNPTFCFVCWPPPLCRLPFVLQLELLNSFPGAFCLIVSPWPSFWWIRVVCWIVRGGSQILCALARACTCTLITNCCRAEWKRRQMAFHVLD